MDLLADLETADDPPRQEDAPPQEDAPQQEDDPLAIDPLAIAEPYHIYTQSGDGIVRDAMSAQSGSGPNVAQAKVPFNPLEKGIQTEMPVQSKATQTQKRSRDKGVQTKEQASERAKHRAEEQNIVALKKEVRILKVRYKITYMQRSMF